VWRGHEVDSGAETAFSDFGYLKVNLQVRASNAGFYQALGFTVGERVSKGRRLDCPGRS